MRHNSNVPVSPSVRYVLYPGYVTSKTDGQYHYIPSYELARLYGVPLNACVMPPGDHMPPSVHEYFWRTHAGLPVLRPRYDGDYRLPPNSAAPDC